MVAAAGDIREDTSLTLACKAELTEHCGGVQPGEGRLWTCLAARRAKASPECESKLFEREVWMSGDWRFKFALKSKCAAEAQLMCQGVAPGGGRVIKCLQSKLDDPKMGKECRRGGLLRSEPSARRHSPAPGALLVVRRGRQGTLHPGQPRRGTRHRLPEGEARERQATRLPQRAAASDDVAGG